MTIHSLTMPVVFGRAIKSKVRPLSFMAQLKTSVVDLKAEGNCLSHAIIISIGKSENNQEYLAYRRGYKIRPAVQKLFAKTGINLSGDVGFPN